MAQPSGPLDLSFLDDPEQDTATGKKRRAAPAGPLDLSFLEIEEPPTTRGFFDRLMRGPNPDAPTPVPDTAYEPWRDQAVSETERRRKFRDNLRLQLEQRGTPSGPAAPPVDDVSARKIAALQAPPLTVAGPDGAPVTLTPTLEQVDAATATAQREREVNRRDLQQNDPTISALRKSRYGAGVAAGAYGSVQGLAALGPWLDQALGVQTPAGTIGKELADRMEEVVSALSPDDPGFLDALASGMGSMATFFIPGITSAKAINAIGKGAPKLAALAGTSVMVILEAGTEAGNVYDELTRSGMDGFEASARANRVFWQNVVLLAATSSFEFGMFRRALQEGQVAARVGAAAERAAGRVGGGTVAAVKGAAKGALSEGIQEGGQEIISERQKLSATESGDSMGAMLKPERLEQIATSAAVGAILGGGAGGVEARIERGRESEHQRGLPAMTTAPIMDPSVLDRPAPQVAAQPGAARGEVEAGPAVAFEGPNGRTIIGTLVDHTAGGSLAVVVDETGTEHLVAPELLIPVGDEVLQAAAAAQAPTTATETTASTAPLAPAAPVSTAPATEAAPAPAVAPTEPEIAPVEEPRTEEPPPTRVEGGPAPVPVAAEAEPAVATTAEPAAAPPPVLPEGPLDLTGIVEPAPAEATLEPLPSGPLDLSSLREEPAPAPATAPATEGGLETPAPGLSTPGAPEVSNQPAEGYGTTNRVFTRDDADSALARLRAKFSPDRVAAGVDFSIIPDLVTYGGYHFEAGLREFGAWSERMVADVGEGVRKYLRPAFEMIATRYDEATAEAPREEGGAGGAAENRPTTEGDTEAGAPAAERPGGADQGALEGAPAADVPRPGEERPAGEQPARGPGEDSGRDGGTDRGGRPGEPGVGVREGDVGVPGERGVGADVAAQPEPGASPLTEPEQPTPAARPVVQGRDYRITDADRIGEGGAKAKYADNVAAIRLLTTLEQEGRDATPEEQAVLVRYVGWGGLKGVFDPRATWDPRHEWRKEHAELKALLSTEEYEAANATVLNAHYTSVPIIRGVWKGLQRLGFAGGRMLETSAGIGHWLGLMPNEVLPGSRRTAIEIDTITGRILAKLYPESDVRVQPFEQTRLADNFYDVVAGNVPFGSYGVHDATPAGRRYRKRGLDQRIHDYFFAKALDKVRPGGVVALISSTGTMDKGNPRVRIYLAQQAELLGAIRLPNSAFKGNARTEVTTDILFLQKRAAPITVEAAQQETWTQTAPVPVGEGYAAAQLPMNRYFHEHPEMVLGQIVRDEMYYGGGAKEEDRGRVAVADDGRDLVAALDEAVARLPQGVIEPPASPATDLTNPKTLDALVPPAGHVKPGGYAVVDGKLFVNKGGFNETGQPILSPAEVEGEPARRIIGMLGVRDAAREVLRVQYTGGTDEALRDAQRILNRVYDAFVAKRGFLHLRENVRAFVGDPDAPFLRALEVWDGATKTATKAPIFAERTVQPNVRATRADSALDALAISLGETATVNWPRMAELTGKDPVTLQDELRGEVFRNPEGSWEIAEAYLSGNVREKLAAARAAAETDPAFRENVDALEAVQPRDLLPAEIAAPLGANWLEPEDVRAFVSDALDISDIRVDVSYAAALNLWIVKVDGRGSIQNVRATSTWGTTRVNAVELIQQALNLQRPVVYDRVDNGDGTTSRVFNPTDTLAAQNKQEEIKARFQEWIWSDEARAERLAKKYNEDFNSHRAREFDGAHLSMAGTSSAVVLREHQKNAIWRILQGGNTLLAHIVGAGKTYVMIGAAMESRRLGVAKKPMLVVPNHIVRQVADDFLKMYPGANILVAGEGDLGAGKRQEFMSRIATGNWDAVLVPHSSFSLLPVSVETYKAFIHEQIEDLKTALFALAATEEKGSRVVREVENAIKRLEDRLAKRLATESKDTTTKWEELGVDQLYVDEAHYFKNLMYATRMRRVKGLSASESNRASDLFMKTQYLTRLNHGRGVIFSTGTPVSNTMAEMYTMLRYLSMPTLRDMGMGHFDAWAGTFGETETTVEMTVSSRFRATTRFARFRNLPEMASLFRRVADVQMDPDQLKLRLPTAKRETVIAAMSSEQLAYMLTLGEREDQIKGRHVDPTVDNMLKISSDGRKNSLDGRLVNPAAPENPTSKANLAVEKIHDIWARTAADRLTQLVFLDLATPKAKAGGATRGAGAAPWQMTLEAFEKSGRQGGSGDAAQVAHLSAVLNAVLAGEAVPKVVAARYATELRSALRQMGRTDALENLERLLRGEKPVRAEEEVGDEETVENADEARGRSSIYEEIKGKLIARGVPAEEIAFIHDAKTKGEKQELFDAVNDGRVRILLGSTDKMGAGTNVQRRLVALHHLDPPWRPADIEQREGRILRQGNQNTQVEIYQYVSQGAGMQMSFDAVMWQALEKKMRFIRQAMTGDISIREAVDVGDNILEAGTIKAIATGNPKMMEYQNATNELTLIDSARRSYEKARQRNQWTVGTKTSQAETLRQTAERVEQDIAVRDAEEQAAGDTRPHVLTIGETAHDVSTREAAAVANPLLVEAIATVHGMGAGLRVIGRYKGLDVAVRTYETASATADLSLRGHDVYGVTTHSATGIENTARGMDTRLVLLRASAQEAEREVQKAREELDKPFTKEARYRELQVRIAALEDDLGITAAKGGVVAPVAEEEGGGSRGEGEGGEDVIQNLVTGILRRLSNPSPVAPTGPASTPLDRKDRMIQEFTGALRRLNAGALTLQGGFHGPAGLHGQRNMHTGNIRLRRITDVDTFAHEAGHALQPALGITLRDLLGFSAEMRALVALQGVKGPKMSEGFAEFVRLYITDPAAAQATAPTFFPWFEARLATAPDFRDAVTTFRDKVTALRSATPLERLSKAIAFEDPEKVPIRERLATAQRAFIFEHFNAYLPIEEVERRADPLRSLPADRSPYLLARTLSGRIQEMARRFVDAGVVDYRTQQVVPGSKGLVQILEPVWAAREDYQRYEVARRIQFLEQSQAPRHREAAGHLRTLTELQRPATGTDPLVDVIQQLEAAHPQFAGVLDELQEWNDGLLQYMADSGNYSQQAIDAIRDANEVYVPLHRLMDPEPRKVTPGEGVGRGTVNTPRAIRALGGRSERIVLPSIEERFKQAYLMVGAAERNAVGQQLADLLSSRLARGKNLGTVMDKIATPIRAHTFPLEQVRKTLTDAFKAAGWGKIGPQIMRTLDLSTLAQVFEPNVRNLPDNQVLIWRDGTAEVWQVHDQMLLRSLTALDRTNLQGFLKGWYVAWNAVRGVSRFFRAGIVLHPDFMAANGFRDQQEAALMGRGVMPPWIKGMADRLMGGEAAERYAAGGGLLFNIQAIDRASIRRSLEDAMEGRWRKGNRVRGALQILEELGEAIEMPTRVGVAKTVLQDPLPQDVASGPRAENVRAAFAGREATIDFGLHGASPATMAYTQIVTFMRPAMNAMYRSGQFFRAALLPPQLGGNLGGRETKRLAMVGGIMMLVEALLWAVGHDDPRWDDLTEEEKTLNWIIFPTPMSRDDWQALSARERLDAMGTVVKIPRQGPIAFFFGAVPRNILEWAWRNDREAALKLLRDFGIAFGADVVPTVVKPAAEVAVNKDTFRWRPINARRVEDLPPEMQAGPYTSGTAKAISGVLADLPAAQAMRLTPNDVDHLVRGYFGHFGGTVTAGVDVLTHAIQGGPAQPAWNLQDYPVARRFLARYPNARSQPIEDFYEAYRDSREAWKGLQALAQRGAGAEAIEGWKEKHPEFRMHPVLEAHAKQFNESKKAIDRLLRDPDLDAREKRDQIDTILLRELDRGRRAMAWVRHQRPATAVP